MASTATPSTSTSSATPSTSTSSTDEHDQGQDGMLQAGLLLMSPAGWSCQTRKRLAIEAEMSLQPDTSAVKAVAVGEDSVLLAASQRLARLPSIYLRCAFQACPRCGSPSTDADAEHGRCHWGKANCRQLQIVVLTMTGPRLASLTPKICKQCAWRVHVHTAHSPCGNQAVMLPVPLEQVGVIRIRKTLYIEVGLLKQLMLQMHTLNSNYESVSQCYNHSWATSEGCSGGLHPSGCDLMQAVQVYELSQLPWHKEIWPWWRRQQQADAASAVPGVTHKMAHPSHAIPAQPPEPWGLFYMSFKDDEDEHTQSGHNLLNEHWEGVVRVAVCWLITQGGMRDAPHQCNHAMCGATSPAVLLLDGCSNINVRFHCCAVNGCTNPPQQRVSTDAAKRSFCAWHASQFQASREATRSDDDDDDDDEEEEEQAVLKPFIRLQGLLAGFLPCGTIKCFAPQYVPESPQSVLRLLCQVFPTAVARPGVVVYNDAPKILAYYKSGGPEAASHRDWQHRFVMDAMRFQQCWNGACFALIKQVASGQQGPGCLEQCNMLTACSPFTRGILKEHLDCNQADATCVWQDVMDELPDVWPHQVCWPSAVRLSVSQLQSLGLAFVRPSRSAHQGYVYVQVVHPDAERRSLVSWLQDQQSVAAAQSAVISAAEDPLHQVIARWHVKVFQLKVATSLAESCWNQMGKQGLNCTSRMTHDHAYLHVHALAKAASQHRLRCAMHKSSACTLGSQADGDAAAAKASSSPVTPGTSKAARAPASTGPAIIPQHLFSLPAVLNVHQRYPRQSIPVDWPTATNSSSRSSESPHSADVSLHTPNHTWRIHRYRARRNQASGTSRHDVVASPVKCALPLL